MKINCSKDPIDALKQMFVNMSMGTRIKAGQCPVRRSVFLKPHGIVKARFDVLPDLPAPFNTGIFAEGKSYESWVRFASDTVPGNSDVKTTTGIGIKLFGVPGEKLLDGDHSGNTADFILQNFNVFFVNDVMEMCEFTYAGVVNHNYDPYLEAHPDTAKILDEMAHDVDSVVDINYWSGLPYSLGSDNYVKYIIQPVEMQDPPLVIPDNNPNYLHDRLKQRLIEGEVKLNFCLQLRTNPETMPLNEAMTPWNEELSPPVTVAVITLLKQDIDAQGQPEYGENLSYNPWRTTADHQPAGSINDARRVVYKASADLRRFKNGVSDTEPISPRNLNQPQ